MVDTFSPRAMRWVQRARVVAHNLHRQPSYIGGESSRGEMVEAHAVLQVADGVLDLGVAAVVGLQSPGRPPPGR